MKTEIEDLVAEADIDGVAVYPSQDIAQTVPSILGPGEIAHQFAERIYRYVVELHDSTARAYGMPTQADFHRAVALRKAATERAQVAEAEAANRLPEATRLYQQLVAEAPFNEGAVLAAARVGAAQALLAAALLALLALLAAIAGAAAHVVAVAALAAEGR